ncbi:MAG: hybrid sensor histidine kinase/response regulator [Deltaproteobacteria bacterium]|nr:hybrid sensor histidine kinase/response regulator [Deltaproteobacteria bacterium]
MERGDQEYQRLVQIFREECQEHIHKLNSGLLALERQPHEAPLDEVLRSAHSLKGASRMMGFKTIEALAHDLETLLTQLVRGEQEITPPIMDALFKNIDAVSHTLKAVEEGKKPGRGDEVLEHRQIAAEPKAPAEAPLNWPAPGIELKSNSPQGSTQIPTRMGDDGALATIRVSTDKLDTLINQVGELLVSKIEALDNLRHIEGALVLLEEWRKRLARDSQQSPLLSRVDSLGEEISSILLSFSENTHRLERLVDEIHVGISELRLLPLSTILEPFPRMVRDLGRDLGKEVELIAEGASTRIDKKVLEELRAPLIHLVRNSVDHGIESPQERERKGKPRQGKILIAAKQGGGRVFISVGDDGQGLDYQTIQQTAIQKGIASAEEIKRWREEEISDLIFRPGFSTASVITEVSGRGVGLDTVIAKVESLKGALSTESKAGQGVTFTLSLPLTLSTIHALLLQTGGDIFCLATDALEKTLLLSQDQISSIGGKTTAVIDGEPLAFSWLADILKLAKEGDKNGTIPALLLANSRGRAVFGVDALLGEEEIVVKGLGKLLSHIPHLSGGTILGKGQIALILNPNELMRSLSHPSYHGGVRPSAAPALSPPLPLTKRKVLVVEDSLTTRTLEKNILEAAGFDVTTAVDGEEALTKLYEKGFDIVVTDIQMPRMDGFALTERIKKDGRFKNIPVILVTALQTEADKRRGIEAGADAYITKGTFNQKHFLEIIRRFI